MSTRTFIGRVGSVTLLLMTFGCSGGSGSTPELARVKGQVTMDGEPLPNVCVHFIPEKGHESVGITNEDGMFEAIYTSKIKGAILGKHRVAIDSYVADDSDKAAVRSRLKIPAKYNFQTTLNAEIERGTNVCDFELTSQ